jgi:nickel-dependent lactate racemase
MTEFSSANEIRFGDERHELRLARGTLAARIEPATVAPRGSAEQIIREALDRPLGSPRLRDIARGRRSAAILVPGKDRVAGSGACLPLLVEELNAGGLPDERIEVVLATGTHARHSAADAEAVLGKETASRVRWREHDCNDDAGLERFGVTSRGTEAFFDRRVLASDVKVLTGRIIPHYFAGFSGGRKALLPGVAGYKTILGNHRLTLDGRGGIHPAVRPCSLRDNPVHLDMVEAARRVEGLFVLNTLLDTGHRVIGAVAGDLEAAHAAGCADAERIFKVPVAGPLDAVITSAGGAPYDCNFMQALKALFDVQEIVRPGGAVLGVAQCPGGMKKGFLRWGAIRSDDELQRAVHADYDLTGHNSIMLRGLVRKARIALWSILPDDQVRAVGIEPVHSLEEGVTWLLAACPPTFRYGVVPFANVTYAAVAGSVPQGAAT